MHDSKFYVQAIDEFKSGNVDPALHAKAYALAKGDTKAQEFQYIQLRVAQLRPATLKDAARNLSFDNVQLWSDLQKGLLKASTIIGAITIVLFIIFCVVAFRN